MIHNTNGVKKCLTSFHGTIKLLVIWLHFHRPMQIIDSIHKIEQRFYAPLSFDKFFKNCCIHLHASLNGMGYQWLTINHVQFSW